MVYGGIYNNKTFELVKARVEQQRKENGYADFKDFILYEEMKFWRNEFLNYGRCYFQPYPTTIWKV